jgi:hypothetical protein
MRISILLFVVLELFIIGLAEEPCRGIISRSQADYDVLVIFCISTSNLQIRMVPHRFLSDNEEK